MSNIVAYVLAALVAACIAGAVSALLDVGVFWSFVVGTVIGFSGALVADNFFPPSR